MHDLEQSWRLYQLAALIFGLRQNFDAHVRHRIQINVMEFIVQFRPKRVWLYVKHLRWMTSAEYAVLRENFIGTAPIYVAKTEALFAPGPEDGVVRGEFLELVDRFYRTGTLC
jgi:hypothetical protein